MMKTLLWIFAVATLSLGGRGGMAAELRAEDFRIVDGVLYNIEKSSKWAALSPGKDLVVVAVLTNGLVVVQERWVKRVYGEPEVDPLTRIGGGGGFAPRPLRSSTDMVGERFVFRNVGRVAEGDKVPSRRTMRVGEYDWAGAVLPLYDFGLENSLENRKTLKVGAPPSRSK